MTDPRQKAAAIRLIDGMPRGEKAMVNSIVLVEFIWTLHRVYKAERADLVNALRMLSEHPRIELFSKDIVRDAAHRAREEGGDLADHIIGLVNRATGCRVTYTFDEDASRFPEFDLLETP